MKVYLRLQKIGKVASKRCNYRIVATSRTKRDSRALEILGYYDPAKQPASLSIDHAKVEKWVKQGACMSDTVKSLVKRSKKT